MKMFQYYDYSERIKTYSKEDLEALYRMLAKFEKDPEDLDIMELSLMEGDKPTNLEAIMELF